MVGVTGILRGQNVTSVLGNPELKNEKETRQRLKYVLRAPEILEMDIFKDKGVFTLEGAE
jgi:hypothetical protein